MSSQKDYPSYPMFKGLQKPLEFMGLQGRYIYWAAATVAAAIFGFIIVYCISGFFPGFLFLLFSVVIGGGMILLKQKRGLHTKKDEQGVFVFSLTRRI